MHRNIIFVHAKTLAEAKFKLKTALGVSDDYYQHCKMFPIYGTGQGSTNSPTILLIISSTLFDIHKELSNRATFSDTVQEIEVHITLVGFVDDVTGQTNDFYNEDVTPEELIHLMQEDAQVWKNLLWLTGGLLELDKCSYHFIWYQFLQDGTPVMQSTRPGPPLIVQQSHNKTHTEIKYKNPYTPHTTLGHLKAPGGGNVSQKNSLQRKSERYAIKASTSSLSHHKAKMYYNSCYIKSVGYVLVQ